MNRQNQTRNPKRTQKGRFVVTISSPPEPPGSEPGGFHTQTRSQIETGTRLNFDSDPLTIRPITNSTPLFPPPRPSSSSSPPMSFFSSQMQTPSQFQTPQQQTPQFQFQPQQTAQLQQLQQVQVQQSQLLLYTKENKAPAGWGTKWEDLHPDSQKVLLQIEERIREYRDESEKLDQCNRLYDSSVSNDSFELDASHIIQELGATNTAIEREKLSVQKLSTAIKELMRNTELAIHSYMLLRSRFVNSASNQTSNQIVPAVPVLDFYNGLPRRPSLYLHHTVDRLKNFLEECIKWIEEVEQLVQMEGNQNRSGSLESLPKVMSNLHDYFIYVASKVENLHQYMEQMKTSYLTEQRRRGDYNSDPFLEANRREAARREAAAMRVHPTLHLPLATPTPAPQISTPNLTPQQPQLPSQRTPLIGSGLFSTPQPAPSSSGLFGAATPPANTNTPFGSGSGSLFGSTPAPSTGFGAGATGFGATPQPAIAGSNLFATPTFGNTSGASFGATSKQARPKTRTGRR